MLKYDRRRVRICFFKGKQVFYRRAPPRINRLVDITDDEEVLVLFGKQICKPSLEHVRILIFIHMNVVPDILCVASYFWMFCKKPHRKSDKVVKVERFFFSERRLVASPRVKGNACAEAFFRTPFRPLVDGHPLSFRFRDTRKNRARWSFFRIDRKSTRL